VNSLTFPPAFLSNKLRLFRRLLAKVSNIIKDVSRCMGEKLINVIFENNIQFYICIYVTFSILIKVKIILFIIFILLYFSYYIYGGENN